jgi:AAA+ superfamily predicted ATPase
MMPPYQNNFEHLKDECRRLDLILGRAVAEFRTQRSQDKPDQFAGLYLSDEEIDALLTSAGEVEKQTLVEAELRDTIQQRMVESQQAGVPLRLPHLSATFGLSPFETDLLILALAPELDRRYQKIYGYLQDDTTRKHPTVDLALRLFCRTLEERVKARAVFDQSATLFTAPLLILTESPDERPAPRLNRFVKIEDRVVEFLLGDNHPDGRLVANFQVVRWVNPWMDVQALLVPEETKAKLEGLAQCWSHATPWCCLLYGPAGVGKKTAAEALSKRWGYALLVLDMPTLLKLDAPLQTLLRVAFREARFYGDAMYIDGWHVLLEDGPNHLRALRVVEEEMERFPGVIFLGSEKAWQPTTGLRQHTFIGIPLLPPNERLRQQLWESHLGSRRGADIDLLYLASAFRFTSGQIGRAIAHAETQAQLRGDANLTTDDLLAGCRLESSQRLISFAKRITPKRVWEDLVLPKDTFAQLHEFCQQVRYRALVYGDWGFAQRLSLGKGLIALFSGASGTGKTLSAEILAHDLGLDLYKVDLASVVSKYIGETEKHLERVFEDAQDSNAILFFDEADALFGKRSEVKDAHDRYANIEINYLLQRVEEYEGVIILASNMRKNIDEAFLRRLHFSIEFPSPDEAHRRRIWEIIFPPQAPLADDIDFAFLARKFKITGGNIKNIAITAAFFAAEAGDSIHMEHLILALKREYQKLGKVCEKTEFEQYYALVR